jgi:hypothetical protein
MKSTPYLLVSMLIPVCAAQPEAARHYLGTSLSLTPPSSDLRENIARHHIESVAADLALTPEDLSSVYIAKQYRTEHNGVTHIIFRQRFHGADVLNAEWVVNLDRDGRILNAGGNLVRGPKSRMLPPASRSLTAVRSAVRAVNPKLVDTFHVLESVQSARTPNGVRFDRGPLPFDVEGRLVWYSVNDELRPAWNFFVADTDRIHRFSVTVDDASQDILKQQPLTFAQSVARKSLPAGTPGGMVFERESPQPVSQPGVRVTTPPPVVDRTLQSFQGDPVASPLGWTDGVATAGNNVIAGENLLGTGFIVPTPSASVNGIFNFNLQLGPNTSPLDYRDAANTNLFYWVNTAHDMHYRYGFDEQSGNFQADNLGRGGVGGDPVYAYTHYGAQALTVGAVENAFFSWQGGDTDDGIQPEIAMYVSAAAGPAGDFFTDGSYDAQVMVHEYTHGVSSRLARQAYNTFQGSSMGEAWSDFYGLEYTLAEGGAPDGLYPLGQYFDQSWGFGGARSRPYSTNMDLNPLTFANIGHVRSAPEVHADGEIWMECMWEMRGNLIGQFGETEGRNRARQIVIDGMKLSIPASTMVDMRDAILLADRVDYGGASQDQIWAAFAKRGMGALAYSDGGNTIHVASSFDTPNPSGAVRFYDNPVVIGEPIRLIYQNPSYTQPTVAIQLTTPSGDSERMILHQHGSIYVGSMSTRLAGVGKNNLILDLVPGDEINASWSDPNGGSGAQATLSTMLPYFLTTSANTYTFGTETKFGPGTTLVFGTLPFQFPFFDKHYGTYYAYSTGLLAFDRPVTSTSCTDAAALRQYIGVTPLWMSLSTTGTAQPNEGIYVSRATDGSSITFRWAAEYTPFAQQPVPVNYAVTLHSDGRIGYNYGSGNHIQPATGSTCGPQAAGLSNGHDTYVATLVFTNWENAANVTYNPPFHPTSTPDGTITAPQPGAHVQDLLTISGTATDSTILRSVDIFIDGVQRTRIGLSGTRASWNAGTFNLPSLGLKPGDHTVQVRVTNAAGATSDVPSPAVAFTMDPGMASLPMVAIERPMAGATITGNLTVSGYAYDADLRVSAVDTLIDGVTRGVTSYGTSRTDICGPLSPAPPNCPAVGFTGTFGTVEANPPISNGKHTLQVRVRDAMGRLIFYPDTPITFTVNNPPIAKIIGVLETPNTNATLSGVTTISGYVYSPGHRITSVSVRVDGTIYASQTPNLSRPDLCPGLPDADLCPAIGFRVTIDTSQFLNGPHIVGVRAVNELGDFLVFPAEVNGGINIFTKN